MLKQEESLVTTSVSTSALAARKRRIEKRRKADTTGRDATLSVPTGDASDGSNQCNKRLRTILSSEKDEMFHNSSATNIDSSSTAETIVTTSAGRMSSLSQHHEKSDESDHQDEQEHQDEQQVHHGNLASIRGIKKKARYDPGVPMTKAELREWRKEARRVRNRESAAASRKKTRSRIGELETDLSSMRDKYEAAMQRIAELESTIREIQHNADKNKNNGDVTSPPSAVISVTSNPTTASNTTPVVGGVLSSSALNPFTSLSSVSSCSGNSSDEEGELYHCGSGCSGSSSSHEEKVSNFQHIITNNYVIGRPNALESTSLIINCCA